jgi:hypothetical protein
MRDPIRIKVIEELQAKVRTEAGPFIVVSSEAEDV